LQNSRVQPVFLMLILLVNVSGEGKIKIVPDQATILATVETKGNNAK
jgi:uncharacterized protein YggE